MAGIGFELDRYAKRDTFTTDAIAHSTAGLVFSGPWAYGITAVLALHFVLRGHMSPYEQGLLFTIITYAYAGAMILTSLLTFVVTRFLADRIYADELEAIGPTYTAAWILHLLAAAVAGALFYLANPLSPGVRLLGAMLLVACTQMWLSGAFISMLRMYFTVAACFFAGYSVSVLLCWLIGPQAGVQGYLLGFWTGLALIALLLTGLLQWKLPFPRNTDFRFLGALIRRPAFAGVGLAFALGVWIDKFIFWFSPGHGLEVTPLLRYFPPYDVTFVLASLSALPGLAWFLMHVEQEFATNVRHVYTSLSRQQTYDRIHHGKVEMVAGMNRDFWGFFRLQAAITLPVMYFAPGIFEWLGMPAHSVHIFRFHCLSALGLVLVQVQVLYCFYYDLPGAALATTGTFLVANTLFTLVTLWLGYWSFGLGSLLATLAATLVGSFVLDRSVRALEYEVLHRFARLSLASKSR